MTKQITVICRNKEKGLQLKSEYSIKILNVDLSDNDQITQCFYKCNDSYHLYFHEPQERWGIRKQCFFE